MNFSGNALNVVVLKHREVQFGDAGTDNDVATGIAAQVEASQISGSQWTAKAWWRWVTVCSLKKAWLGATGTAKQFVLM